MKKYFPFIFILILVVLFFWKFFLKGLIPIPADLVVGAYFPWLDYKWGYEIGVPVKNPITSDVVSQIYPMKSYLVDQLHRGGSSLWNPTMFGGYPLLANPILAAFSPTFILYFILPKITAWSLQIIIQPILAAVFTYLLLRHFKLSKIASTFGGLFFAFSGFNLIWLEWNIHSLTSAWIPLLFLLIDKYIYKKEIKYLIYFSIVLALQILSGYPQIVLYTLLALGVFVLIRRKVLIDKYNLKILIFVVVGILLSSIQVIPMVEMYLRSQRVSETISSDIMFLPFKHLIALFAPDYFGNHATYNFWGKGNYTNNVIYCGLVVFVLATIGLANKWKNIEIKYYFWLFLVTLFVALPFTLSKILFNFWLHGSTAASATRILIMTNFSMAVVAAYGIEALTYKGFKWIYKSLLIPFATLLMVFVYSINKIHTSRDELIIRNMNVGIRNIIFPTILLFSLLILFYSFKYLKSFKTRLLIIFIICFLATIELFRFGWKYTPFSKNELIFPETPVITFLKEQKKPFRVIGGDVIPKNMWTPYFLESLEGYDPVYPKSVSKFLGVLDKGNENAEPLDRYGFISNYDSPLINLINVKYILVNVSNIELIKKLINKGYKQAFTDKSVIIYENTNFIPRAFLTFDWEVSSDNNYIFKNLLESKSELNEKVYLEKDPKIEKSKKDMYLLNFEKYDSGKIILSTNSTKDGILFISNVYFPGWKASIDNNQTEIIKADATFQSIVVPKGEHKIEFIYDPKSFKIGKLVTISIFVTLILFYYYEKRRK